MSNNQISKLKLGTSSDDIEYDMKKSVETKEDGRKLIYYTFVRKAAEDGSTTGAAPNAEQETAGETDLDAAAHSNRNPKPANSQKKHEKRGDN